MVNRGTITQDETASGEGAAHRRLEAPGVLVLFACGAPAVALLPLERGAVTLGRDSGGPLFENDGRLSRRHAEIVREAGLWRVRDAGSRNGTFVDGVRVEGEVTVAAPRVVRVAGALVRPVEDVRPFLGAAERGTLRDGDAVAGPAFAAALAAARRAGVGSSLLVTGESGAGKELVARAFHSAAGGARGPLVPVNCAALPKALAERQLFGARRGAYSGADADADGYVQAAEGGTLFLDEVGELEPEVQAKLLRFLETREVTPLGAPRPQRVATRVCAATHRDLRAAVAAERFRADLFFRLAEPSVALPPLRERPEEIPWLAASALGPDAPTRMDARFVEALLLRSWPGNARELLGAVRAAAERARVAGDAELRAEHLAPEAGRATERAAEGPAPEVAAPAGKARDAEVLAAYRAHRGNVAEAARALGMHRTQLYRELRRLGVERG